HNSLRADLWRPAHPPSASRPVFLFWGSVTAPGRRAHPAKSRRKLRPAAALRAAVQFGTLAGYDLPEREFPIAFAPGSRPRAPAATPSSAFPGAAFDAPPG